MRGVFHTGFDGDEHTLTIERERVADIIAVYEANLDAKVFGPLSYVDVYNGLPRPVERLRPLDAYRSRVWPWGKIPRYIITAAAASQFPKGFNMDVATPWERAALSAAWRLEHETLPPLRRSKLDLERDTVHVAACDMASLCDRLSAVGSAEAGDERMLLMEILGLREC